MTAEERHEIQAKEMAADPKAVTPRQRQAEFRRVLMTCCTAEDLREVVQVVMQKAKEGDLDSCKEILTRLCGKEQDENTYQVMVIPQMMLRNTPTMEEIEEARRGLPASEG